jgi:hypothetical protein
MKFAFGYVTQQDNLGLYSFDNEIYENMPVGVHFFILEAIRRLTWDLLLVSALEMFCTL